MFFNLAKLLLTFAFWEGRESYEESRKETKALISKFASETKVMVREALAPYSPRDETVSESTYTFTVHPNVF